MQHIVPSVLGKLWEEQLHVREGEGILGSKCVRTLNGN